MNIIYEMDWAIQYSYLVPEGFINYDAHTFKI